MKEIALKAVTIALPKGADLELQRALQKAEETIRENNALVERTSLGRIGKPEEGIVIVAVGRARFQCRQAEFLLVFLQLCGNLVEDAENYGSLRSDYHQ